MKPRFGCLIALSMLTSIAATASIARAQPVEFDCPKAGTVATAGVYTTRYTGDSAADPYVCNSLSPWNKPQALLFNFYAVDGMNAVPVSDTRSKLLDLFAGRRASVVVTTSRGTTDTWTILRHERVTIAGKTSDAIVLSQDRVRFLKSFHQFHGFYERWLDAKSGLWIRADLHLISGEMGVEAKPYEVSVISEP
jgi:hypothetical protein